jgi:hypothetical protein
MNKAGFNRVIAAFSDSLNSHDFHQMAQKKRAIRNKL